jgi:uncharacterized protein DUF4055
VAEEQKNNPSYECKDYKEMRPRWQIVDDVSKGTLHLRECRSHEYYLPKEPAEDSKDYAIRKQRAVLFNAFERTLHGLVGMVFRKEPKMTEDVPEVIRGREATEDQEKVEGYAENIDNSGSHWTVFAKEALREAIQNGHSFILVDMPPALPEGSTLADERAIGRRPYWVHYSSDQAVNWRVSFEAGRAVITQITFKECSYEEDGLYGEKEVVKYRVLRPGSWELWREIGGPQATINQYILEASGATSLNEIPVVAIYSRKTGYLTSRPPLLDLALLNICHYQKYSDYSTYLHISSRPVLWFRGRDSSKKLEPIGPYTAFDVDPQNGEVAFAETTGAALSAAREDLQDLEKKMAALGISIIAGKAPQPNTATEELLDHVQEESDLATAARSLKDGLERALYFTALYIDQNAETGGSVELGATIEELTLTDQELQAYSNMQNLGQLSLQTFWSILERAGKLPEDFDREEEQKLVDQEQKDKQDAMLKSFERGDSFRQGGA